MREMDKLYTLEDKNEIDGGILTVHSDGANHLVMIESEHGKEVCSVYLTLDDLDEIKSKLVENGAEF